MHRGLHLIKKRKFQSATPADAEDAPNGEVDESVKAGNADEPSSKKVSDREAELLKEVMKRKGNEQTLKGELTSLQDQLKQFDGIDPKQVRELLQERAERERAELEKRGEFDRVKQQMAEQHKSELDTLRASLESQVGEMTQKLESAESLITELTIGRSFSDSGFVRDSLTLTPSKARVVYGNHFELQDGKVVAYDKPAGASDRTMLVDGGGEPMAFDLAIQKIVRADPDHEHLIRSKVRNGAGSKSDADTPSSSRVGAGRSRIAAALNSGALKQPVK